MAKTLGNKIHHVGCMQCIHTDRFHNAPCYTKQETHHFPFVYRETVRNFKEMFNLLEQHLVMDAQQRFMMSDDWNGMLIMMEKRLHMRLPIIVVLCEERSTLGLSKGTFGQRIRTFQNVTRQYTGARTVKNYCVSETREITAAFTGTTK